MGTLLVMQILTFLFTSLPPTSRPTRLASQRLNSALLLRLVEGYHQDGCSSKRGKQKPVTGTKADMIVVKKAFISTHKPVRNQICSSQEHCDVQLSMYHCHKMGTNRQTKGVSSKNTKSHMFPSKFEYWKCCPWDLPCSISKAGYIGQ